jgi:predicted MFS family arabinose efflux permease
MLQKAFFLAPICAVIGSLAAQYVLSGRIHLLKFPYDFASLYALGFLCLIAVTVSSLFYQLVPVADEDRPPLFRALLDSSREYFRSTPLVLLFGTYLLGCCAIAVSPTLSLYTPHAVATTHVNFSGLLMAFRFGGKSVGGYLLGVVAIRWGLNASITTSLALLVCAILWGWLVPGYSFLFAFGLIGAGELSAAYIPNYSIAFSRPKATARNLSLLMMASPLAGISPALYGFLADHWGFNASFAFALGTALVALGLISCLRKRKAADSG